MRKLLLTLIVAVGFTIIAFESRPPAQLTYEPVDTLKKMIPYTLPWDDMPIDISFVFRKEKPAGKHGFLKVAADKFVFEDNTEVRFWGETFNCAANFPSHEYSEKVAKRLSKTGINIVRLCVLDYEDTPNIFQFTKGENKTNTQNFDPESMERFDYLVHCLKEEGIYLYFDGLVFRKFKSGDGVEAAEKLGIGAKPYSTYNRKLIELQKKYNCDLWTHINPYTKLAYKDDPAVVLFDITNENDLWAFNRISLEPYRTELELLYRQWAQERKIKVSKETLEFNLKDINIQNFFMDITKDYYREMILHLRETGVKIPIAGTNSWVENAAYLSCQFECDFTDGHGYWYKFKDAEGIGYDYTLMNDPMTGSTENIIPHLAFNRLQDKPFFVSEWDNPYPNEWRAESSLLMAAVGSFQGWGGIIKHAYRNLSDEINLDMIGYSPILGWYGGIFHSFNDPAKFGLYYHAALITRRGDVKPAEKTVNLKLDSPFAGRGKSLQLNAEKHRVETVLPGHKAKGDIVINPDRKITDFDTVEVMSDTKELYRNLDKKTGWIDTPDTKAVYGFVGKEGQQSLSGLKVNVKTDFATVAISSLTDEPIKSSTNMLLTTIGRVENTNSRYNEDHTKQLEIGHGPVLIEIIEASFEIETFKKNLHVISINPQGLTIGEIPSEYKDGIFRFEIGKVYQSMYYLIQEIY